MCARRSTKLSDVRRIAVSGRVQGVGFRPFVYRLAQQLHLKGWVLNSAGRVIIHAEGHALDEFARRIISDAPPLARPVIESVADADREALPGFEIRHSEAMGAADVHVPPDLFCCDDCLRELSDPAERRHAYAFTNCTQCGPRYTIIASLPYDRPNTAMAGFPLCPACRAEYENPADRRFHAQPLACPVCGPRLSFERPGHPALSDTAAIAAAVALLHDGGIVAAKGVGGYHLLCDAANDAAVTALRARKHRPHKPFAIMALPGVIRGLVAAEAIAAQACADPLRPIVLMARHPGATISAAVAPGLNELGVFQPYSPLHYLLLQSFDGALVATSGNISGEPVITDDDEARARLSRIADAILTHNRPILRPADDSVLRVIAGSARVIRLGRGLAPHERDLPQALASPVLATGGQMKGAMALGFGTRAVLSPHIGELDTKRGLDVFEQLTSDLQSLYRVKAEVIACDLHPAYAATRWAKRQGLPVRGVQHHIAHAAGLAGEYPDITSWLTFAWDGVGLGSDGTLWGGEAFLGRPGRWQRVASLRPFDILGGDRAAREPWRSAAALLWAEGQDGPSPSPLAHAAWEKRLGTHTSSSVGRLFDAAACLILGLDIVSYEGQGPMQLEAMADDSREAIALPFLEDAGQLHRLDWAPLLPLLKDAQIPPARRAAIFHESLAAAIAGVASRHASQAIGLTGGVFQNRQLAERTIARLTAQGRRVFLPRDIPANDGGLAFGQLIEVLHSGGQPL